MTLILASASPRRRELLGHLGVDFEVVVSGFEEPAVMMGRPVSLARMLARSKALETAARRPEAFVLAADTVVAHRGRLLGKPADAEQARDMLRQLRDRWHRVTTAVALLSPGRSRPRVVHAISRVHMRPYPDTDVEAAIAAGVPFDKAGGYGIQDPFLHPVDRLEGCFCNVMGFPLWTVAQMLRAAGIEPSTAGMPDRCAACPARPDPGV